MSPPRPTRRLRALRLANPVVRAVLRSPAHRLLDRSLLLLTYRGRRSGHAFTIPVLYAEADGRIVVLAARPAEKLWWRSIGEGASVTVRLRGAAADGRARALVDAGERRAALSAYLDRFPRSERVLGVPAGLEGAARDRALDDASARVALVAITLERAR